MYKNRLQKLAEDKKSAHLRKAIGKNKYGEKLTHQPKTLEKSNKLADKRFPSRASLNVEDRLLRQKQDYQLKNEE